MSSIASRKPAGMMLLGGVLAALLLFSACGGKKAPAEANALLAKALQSLADKDFEAFRSCLVPGQRASMESVEEMPFFAAAVAYEIDNEFDTNVTDTTASVFATLYFTPDKKEFSTINWALRREAGDWAIDLAETIRGEKARNGANAFQSWIIKVRNR